MDKVIYTFPVLYEGWEMDENGYIKETDDGDRYLILTSHGMEYKADPQELRDKIDEYRNAIKMSEHALSLLTNKE